MAAFNQSSFIQLSLNFAVSWKKCLIVLLTAIVGPSSFHADVRLGTHTL